MLSNWEIRGFDYVFKKISEAQAVIICVPTPLNKHREPDISYVLNSAREIGKYITQNTLVVLESTTYPGTTDTDLRKAIESGKQTHRWQRLL